MDYKNLKLLGTSHIARQSIKEIKEQVDSFEPSIICVELDKGRLFALMNEQKRKINYASVFKIGLKGFLFGLLGSWVSKKLGKVVGVSPGADMKTAVEIARTKKLKLALIDQDIQITLKNFSKSLGWKEKWNFMVDIFRGIFFKKKQMKEYGLDSFDLTKVPKDELITKIIARTKKRYPGLYKVLIDDRNKVMSRNLIKLMKMNPDNKILTVVGAGHKEGMMKIIKEKYDKIEVINHNSLFSCENHKI